MNKETKKELGFGCKICKNGKKWGENNSYQKESYRRQMREIKLKNSKYHDKDGYVTISVVLDGDITGTQVYEHRYIIEKELGRRLTTTEQVHHINGIRDDNSRENLMLCASKKDHMEIHRFSKVFNNVISDRVNSSAVFA